MQRHMSIRSSPVSNHFQQRSFRRKAIDERHWFLFIMGAGSFVLNLIGMEFKLLM